MAQHRLGRVLSVGENRGKGLLEAAAEARRTAYVPYSHFAVGAAVRTASGRIFTGCNIENASYGATCCAERTAMFKAISEGETVLQEIAVVADTDRPCSPCGICRQVMAELGPNMTVWLGNLDGEVVETSTAELLPYQFDHEFLGADNGS